MELRKDYIMLGDCYDLLARLPDGSVDAVITDPPYGITDNPWDTAPDLHRLLPELWRVLKPSGAMLVFGQEPFASRVRLESGHFRYDWVWDKVGAKGFLNAKKMPLRRHENITVHYRKLPTYNPQFTQGKPYRRGLRKCGGHCYGGDKPHETVNEDGRRYPTDIIAFPGAWQVFTSHVDPTELIHPTQKPIALMEYLVRTYTDEGQVVLDPFMGSGTTAVACLRTGRHYIGSEQSADYHAKSLRRIEAHRAGMQGE